MQAERQRQHQLDAEQEADRVAAVALYEVCAPLPPVCSFWRSSSFSSHLPPNAPSSHHGGCTLPCDLRNSEGIGQGCHTPQVLKAASWSSAVCRTAECGMHGLGVAWGWHGWTKVGESHCTGVAGAACQVCQAVGNTMITLVPARLMRWH